MPHHYTRAMLDAVPVVNPKLKTERAPLEGDVPSPITPPPGLYGILAEQADEVMAMYRDWFVFDPPAIDEGWVRLVGVKQ